jgi:hypothetical protein
MYIEAPKEVCFSLISVDKFEKFAIFLPTAPVVQLG